VPSGLYRVSVLQTSSPCIIKRCPSNPSLRNLITMTMSNSS
jgi:hypothetical protein